MTTNDIVIIVLVVICLLLLSIVLILLCKRKEDKELITAVISKNEVLSDELKRSEKSMKAINLQHQFKKWFYFSIKERR